MTPRGDIEPGAPDLISIVYPYYNNPGMLAALVAWYAAFPGRARARLELVLVDDGSREAPLDTDLLASSGLAVQAYRIETDKPWNQHGARNLGAWHAAGARLILTDIDHLLPADGFAALHALDDAERFYWLCRAEAGTGRVLNPHVNSFFVSKRSYWRAGGYDEDYCGTYGTDKFFRRRVLEPRPPVLPATLVLHRRETVADADTTTLSRRITPGMRWRWKCLGWQKRLGLRPPVSILQLPYRRLLPV